MSYRKRALGMFSLLTLMAVQANAFALTVKWTASGSVLLVDDYLKPYFVVGDSAVLRFTYDTDTTPLFQYLDRWSLLRLTELTLTVGAKEYDAEVYPADQWPPSPYVEVKNDGPYDEFIIPYVKMVGLRVSGLDAPRLYFGLVDFTSTAFGSDLLPPTELGVLTCNINCGFISYFDVSANSDRRVVFDFESLLVETASAVPEPGTLALLGLGLAGLGLSRRRLAR